MPECENSGTAVRMDQKEDVDDLIFHPDQDWLVSDR